MRVTKERIFKIFGQTKPPSHVWEQQFDYFDEELQRLSQTPRNQIEFNDLWVYFHDLAYIKPLQEDLFKHLFPVCLLFWYDSLMTNKPCATGDAEFHNSLVRGNILESMISDKERLEVYNILHDGFLDRIELEIQMNGHGCFTIEQAFGWILRLNSLGYILPDSEFGRLWQSWWRLESKGQDLAGLQYISCLLYGETILSPLFCYNRGPEIWDNDSMISHMGWPDENIAVLREMLIANFINQHLKILAEHLAGQKEGDFIEPLTNTAEKKSELVERNIQNLIDRLSEPILPVDGDTGEDMGTG